MNFEKMMNIQNKIPLKERTWWKTGGSAEYFCLPSHLSELQTACQWAQTKKLPIHVLSGGTNTLVSDKGVSGLVIGLNQLNDIQVKESQNKICISALAGVPKHQLFKIFSQYKLAPALFLCGLPGDTGGGVVMNAGVGSALCPKEFVEIVDSIQVLSLNSLELQTFKKKDLQWGYRFCTGWELGIIFRVELQWPLEPLEDFHQKLKQVNKQRVSTQPLGQASCGSVFKNPRGEKSGRLIEKAGLKGFRIGGAEVSHKHANFIVNKNQASAQDIHQVICHVRNTVKEKFGIVLEPEVRYIGDWPADS